MRGRTALCSNSALAPNSLHRRTGRRWFDSARLSCPSRAMLAAVLIVLIAAVPSGLSAACASDPLTGVSCAGNQCTELPCGENCDDGPHRAPPPVQLVDSSSITSLKPDRYDDECCGQCQDPPSPFNIPSFTWKLYHVEDKYHKKSVMIAMEWEPDPDLAATTSGYIVLVSYKPFTANNCYEHRTYEFCTDTSQWLPSEARGVNITHDYNNVVSPDIYVMLIAAPHCTGHVETITIPRSCHSLHPKNCKLCGENEDTLDIDPPVNVRVESWLTGSAMMSAFIRWETAREYTRFLPPDPLPLDYYLSVRDMSGQRVAPFLEVRERNDVTIRNLNASQQYTVTIRTWNCNCSDANVKVIVSPPPSSLPPSLPSPSPTTLFSRRSQLVTASTEDMAQSSPALANTSPSHTPPTPTTLPSHTPPTPTTSSLNQRFLSMLAVIGVIAILVAAVLLVWRFCRNRHGAECDKLKDGVSPVEGKQELLNLPQMTDGLSPVEPPRVAPPSYDSVITVEDTRAIQLYYDTPWWPSSLPLHTALHPSISTSSSGAGTAHLNSMETISQSSADSLTVRATGSRTVSADKPPQLPAKKVVLIYSLKTNDKEIQVIFGILVNGLEEFEGVCLRCPDISVKNIHEWVEREVKEAHTVLCVCNQQFSEEWERGEVANSPVACLRRLLPTCQQKVAVVLLRQSHKVYRPSNYLCSQPNFLVTAVSDLGYYITGVPKYALGQFSSPNSS